MSDFTDLENTDQIEAFSSALLRKEPRPGLENTDPGRMPLLPLSELPPTRRYTPLQRAGFWVKVLFWGLVLYWVWAVLPVRGLR